jgi:SAM-dependent methyltransferase
MDVVAVARRELGRVRRVASAVRTSLRTEVGAAAVPATVLPVAGYPPGTPAGPLEQLDDDELAVVNGLLPWTCFTVDSRGRRLGDRRRSGKRENPQPIPDWRVPLADERFDLADKSVLEVGCFEGVHTIALSRAAAEVTAIDSHVVNVVKTVVRCNLYGHRPVVYRSDVETWGDDHGLSFDVVFHVGVLYHLLDPVTHLARLGQVAQVGLLLDTMVATEVQAAESMTVGSRELRFYRYSEPIGAYSVLAGMNPDSRWLLLTDIVALLHEAGFASVDVVSEREERNGRRVTLVASKE